jgi:GT2 family glycosyltransferase
MTLMQKRLAIVVLNYHQADLTIECLSFLNSEVEVGRDIVIVVENGSEDDSAARIEAAICDNHWHSWVRLVCCSPNKGFAGGNNVGILSADAQFYVLLNNDTIVRSGTFASLLTAIRARPQVGLIGPRMSDSAGQFSASCFRDRHPISEFLQAARTGVLSRVLNRYDVHLRPPVAPVEVDWIGFACVLIRREVIEQVGLLDAGYYLYFDDNDYCRRARSAGWKVLYLPDATIVHLMGATTRVTTDTAALDRRPPYYYASRARYFVKFYGRSGLWVANVLWLCGRAVSLIREVLHTKRRHTCQHEGRDIWIHCMNPLRLALGPASDKKGKRDRDNSQGRGVL